MTAQQYVEFKCDWCANTKTVGTNSEVFDLGWMGFTCAQRIDIVLHACPICVRQKGWGRK